MAYTDTIITGIKSVSGNRVTQVYVTGFCDVKMFPLTHRIEARSLLSWYFIYDGVTEHIHSDNTW